MEAKTKDSLPREQLDDVVVRFAGDSGDGIQLTGTQFTNTTGILGNDLATFPDFPAEIRAPAGTLPGVSGFQIRFSSNEIHTPGSEPDVLVAMNPAALKLNLKELKPGGILILNTDAFTQRNLERVGFSSNPLEDHSLDGFRTVAVPLTDLTRKALESCDITPKEKDRCKNFFALGITYWLFNRPAATTNAWIDSKFKGKPDIAEANRLALKGGVEYGRATELFQTTYDVPPAKLTPGTYRNISGNAALAMGLVAAAQRAGITLFQGSYPITPASDVLHELSRFKNYGVITFQAEDEIAAVTSAIGASFAGALGITTTSGPGMALKGEAMGLAVMTELPLIIMDIQRGGPSTGLPTKTEQADLLMAIFGRNSECPMPVIAAATPGDCFWMAFEAVRIALTHMTPVVFLSDGYLANGTEPFRLPEIADLPEIRVNKAVPGDDTFMPYLRDPDTLARPWAVPGVAGMEHRIGGLEKADGSGNVSYDAHNHEHMIRTRQAKVDRVAQDIPPSEVYGAGAGSVLVVGWGGTYGSLRGAVEKARKQGWNDVGHLHLRHLNPLPPDLQQTFAMWNHILVPELNSGQLLWLLRAKYLIPAVGLSKVQGLPFTVDEILAKIDELRGDKS